MRASFVEEKKISMLKQPLRSEGTVLFSSPGLLLRNTTRPELSTMLLDGDVLRISDASGARMISLGESPIVRHFVLTFVYVLRGDRRALEQLYTLTFRSLPDESH
jgi:outer membrane lipoprotein-sorting protein